LRKKDSAGCPQCGHVFIARALSVQLQYVQTITVALSA
jgi:predicted RNA-binding Zn-ribbon protein involved in translation (DUF1610 family)